MNLHLATNLDTLYCIVCRGTGTVFEEHADGSLSEQPCPYCHGSKNSTWVKDRYEHRLGWTYALKALICAYWAVVWLVIDPMGQHNIMIPVTAWAIGIVGGVWMWVHPSPSKRRQRKARRGPDPMTTDKERLLGAAVIGGALLYADLQARWDATHPGR